jgi:hypothetical protein
MRRFTVAGVLLALLVPAPTAGSSSIASGLHGAVTLSPASPVCIEDQPCSKPAPGVVIVFRRDGRARATVTTTSRATYRVLLRPGWYTLVAPMYRRGTGVAPRRVRVASGRIARVDLEIDTGMQ